MSNNFNDLLSERVNSSKKGVICEVHHILKKFYLVNEQRFVCEYDGYDVSKTKMMHFHQFLEQNKDKLPVLQGKAQNAYTPKQQAIVNSTQNILNKVSKEASDVLKESENFKNNMLNKSTPIYTQDGELAKQIVNQLQPSSEAGLDLSKIQFTPEKETLLVVLSHLLNETNQKPLAVSKNPLTPTINSNIESLQHEGLDLMNNLYDLIDKTYGELLPELGASEGIFPDNKARNLLKDYFIPRKNHEEIVKNLQKALNDQHVENDKLRQELHNRDKNTYLPEGLKQENELFKSKMDELNWHLRDKDEEIQALKNALAKRRGDLDKAIDDLDKQKENSIITINELEREIFTLKKQYKDTNEIIQNQALHREKIHNEELERMKDHYNKLMEDAKASSGSNMKNLNDLKAERDALKLKNNDLLIENLKLREQLPALKDESLKKANMIIKERDDINNAKDKLLQDLKNERERQSALEAENAKLRSIKNELELLVLELREKLENYKVADQRNTVQGKQQESENARTKLQYEAKMATLEDLLKENQNRFNLKSAGYEKQIGDFINEQKEFSNAKIHYLERIAELEREIILLRNQLKDKDADIEKGINENKNLKNIIERLKENNFNTNLKHKETEKLNQHLVQAAAPVTDVNALKENYMKKINSLENELQKEKDNLLSYTQSYQEKVNKATVKKAELRSDIDNLNNQIDFLKAELEKEKTKNQKKIDELNNMLKEFNLNKEAMKVTSDEEKNKLHQNIANLQKQILSLQEHQQDKNDQGMNSMRVKELEHILLEERDRNKALLDENKRLKNGLNLEYEDMLKNSDSMRKKLLDAEGELNELRAQHKKLTFENELLKKHSGDLDANVQKMMEENKEAKINTEKLIRELTSQNRELIRKNNQLEHDNSALHDEIEFLKKNGTCSDHEKKISDLRRENMELDNLNKIYEKELDDLPNQNKALQDKNAKLEDIIKQLKHDNEALKLTNEELKNYHDFYKKLKTDYDDVIEENELLKSKNAGLHDLNLEAERLKSLLNKSEFNNKQLAKEIETLEKAMDNYQKEIQNKDHTIQDLKKQIEALNHELDSRDHEIQALVDKHDSLVPKSYAEELEHRLKEAHAENEKLGHNISQQNNKIKELNDEIEELKHQNKSLLDKHGNLVPKSLVEDLEHKLNQAEAENEKLGHNLTEKNHKIQELEDELKAKKGQIIDKQYEIDQLKNQNKEQKLIIDNLKKLLEEKEKVPEPKKHTYKNIDFTNDNVNNELLVNTQNWGLLKTWLSPYQKDHNVNIKCNLLYKASRDGFGQKVFKEKCQRFSPTLIVVHTSHDKLIGGFTPLKWDYPKVESHEYSADLSGKTFLFSLSLGQKYNLVKQNYAICNAKSMGPIFGAGSDLEIMDECNKNANNFSGIGKSFDYKGTPELFYGGVKFTVKDYECYEVLL